MIDQRCVIDHRESVGGSTALFLAARRGNAMTVRTLLEAGVACLAACDALLRVLLD